MLIAFPLGLLGMAVVFDIIYLVTGTRGWSTVSFWMIAAGVISGLIAAQLPDGYLGTYPNDKRWTAWDVWVHKYDLIGLLRHDSEIVGNQ